MLYYRNFQYLLFDKKCNDKKRNFTFSSWKWSWDHRCHIGSNDNCFTLQHQFSWEIETNDKKSFWWNFMLAFWLLVFFHPSLPPPHRTSIASPEFHLFESDRNKIETRQLDIIMEITGFLTFLFILMGTYPTCNSGNTFFMSASILGISTSALVTIFLWTWNFSLVLLGENMKVARENRIHNFQLAVINKLDFLMTIWDWIYICSEMGLNCANTKIAFRC